MTRVRAVFNDAMWDERIDFVEAYFDKNSSDTEDITIDAYPGGGIPYIGVEYRSIRNKQLVEKIVKIQPDLLTKISHTTTELLLSDLLNWLRSSK
jgi:hypothetical protein